MAADGTHVVCFGHDYDDYGAIMARSSLLNEDKSDEYRAEIDANARLLAAAPDLLAALKQMTEEYIDLMLEQGLRTTPNLTAAESAIAKAEGR